MENWSELRRGGNQMCMLWGDTPEGLRGSRLRRCSEGSSVGSLWWRRGGTMVSEKRLRDRGKN